MIASLIAWTQCSTVESETLDPDELLLKEVCGSNDGGVAVTLDDLEVCLVLGHHLRFPPASANGDQDVERETLRGAGREWA